MRLEILLSSTLRQYIPEYDPNEGISLVVKERMTVAGLCERINIPVDKIKIVMVNGRAESLEYVLEGDKRVGLFPPLGGG